MPYLMTLTMNLQQCDDSGNVDGQSYSFTGTAIVPTNTPAAADLNAAAVTAGAIVRAAAVAGFPVQQAEDNQC